MSANRSIREDAAGDWSQGRARVVIEAVSPNVDGGLFPAKRVVGDRVTVEADVFADGHDAVSAVVLYRRSDADNWSEAAMKPLVNDRWSAQFAVEALGTYSFTVCGWIDRFVTWQRGMRKRVAAGQDVAVEQAIGAELVCEAAAAAQGFDADRLHELERRLREGSVGAAVLAVAEDEELSRLMGRYAPRRFATTYAPELTIWVDRPKAGFSAWYEMFPRSAAAERRHGTLKDVEARLPYGASMGFDVLYLPPIHPIGRSYRKGPNNATEAAPDDPGSPWGIGSEEGGHTAIHPQLGTMADFRDLRAAAERAGVELAMDIAFQASPDHPWVGGHREWFRKRPDGTIQYAENPPKKYQDIYPLDFECDAWQSLWQALKDVFLFWINEGVRIFRVDNPHTKPFRFWQWVIDELRQKYPETIFLAEAFTRPRVMERLAKIGFTQSYTYFAWRDTKYELTTYLNQLTRSELREYFRPNLWPNTPDILPESLQVGGRPAFMARLVLAATLSGNYGIYGPPFEHGWSAPREPGSEEYLHSEKYEIHHHDLHRADSLHDFIARVNQIRKSTPSIAHAGTLEFHSIDNEQLICYSRVAPDLTDVLLAVVNLDPWHVQSGWVDFPIDRLELPSNRPYQMHDLLSDARYLWHGNRNYVELDPQVSPAHLFRLRRRARSERDFEYYL
ncbi:MAG: alpha-1,4-glucan--maltose-1-phosphate maltosyltransferase [Pirellulales bacterium]|nr:alpha-1,4-glucan--maltose-1-phosphate maltosyltransferase [Pirellulales bacterium]